MGSVELRSREWEVGCFELSLSKAQGERWQRLLPWGLRNGLLLLGFNVVGEALNTSSHTHRNNRVCTQMKAGILSKDPLPTPSSAA